MPAQKANCEIETSLTIQTLLESGAQFGHQTKKWHPKVEQYLIGKRNSIHIIDVAKTLESIREAGKYIVAAIKEKKSILFVGTKRPAKDVLEYVAKECEEYFINERWPGGLLTNPSTRSSVNKIKILDVTLNNPENDLGKREILRITKKRDKLFNVFKGVMDMEVSPGLMIIVDIKHESLALSEAKLLNIPVIGLVDTNGDPSQVDCPIVVNDDSVKSISAVLGELGQIVSHVKQQVFGTKEIAEDEMQAKIDADEES